MTPTATGLQRRSWSALCGVIGLTTLLAPLSGQTPTEIEGALKGLAWRSIGPAEMGGRTVDIAGIPGDPTTVYMATGSGGLWKTVDGGTTWRSIFESGNTLSLGAVEVAPSDHNVVYIGTGEHNPRNSMSIGDGVYRSTDRGNTWKHLGLTDTERIGRIRVHPHDPDILFVAAMGHAWGPNEERGVFRSKDGGTTWEKVLYVDENTGAADLIINPDNPRVLFAALYDYRRQPFHFRSGGPGSGLYRSTDGGDTWKNLTGSGLDNGLPAGVLGRIGLANTPANADVVYSIIESKDKGVLWRSDDGGDQWRVASRQSNINGRPFYYSDIRLDPTDENRIYVLSGGFSVSDDGGRTFRRIANNIHGDHQSLWIDPLDPHRLINGNDGGFHFSFDRGETWNFVNVVPLAQVYQLGADMRDPYYVCAGLQDNDAWCGPSRTLSVTGPLMNQWYEIIGPGDGMYVQIDPTDHNIMYANSQGGSIYRFDLGTGEARSIQPYPMPWGGSGVGDHPYRFNWNAPVHMSPHDPGTIYFGGNVLFRTVDGGQSWDEISPDLTTNDSTKLVSSGGPITPDNTSAEYHSTIYTIAESPVEQGVIWVGTDDGNLQVTHDGGTSWENVISNVENLPSNSWVSRVEASRTNAGVAYATFDRHRSDDMAPYVFKTTDYGAHWRDITDNLPERGYVHVVREDPRNPQLVYVGTELGIFASWTGGGNWSSLRLKLPPVAVRDILIHPRDNDLIIGTHGLSVWILDDLTPLQQLAAAMANDVHLFEPRVATRYQPWAARYRFDIGDGVFVGENPAYGVMLSYYLNESVADTASARDNADSAASRAEKPDTTVRVVIVDSAGDTVRTLGGPRKPGLQRISWNLRRDSIPAPDTASGEANFRYGMTAPLVMPGRYTAHLSTGEHESSAPVVVRLDPRSSAEQLDLAAQQSELLRLWEMATMAVSAVRRIDIVKPQLDDLVKRLGLLDEPPSEIIDTVKAVVSQLDSIRASFVRPEGSEEAGAWLLDKISSLSGSIGRAAYAPTEAQSNWTAQVKNELDAVLERLSVLMESRIPALNRQMNEAGVPRIISGV